MSEKHKEAAKNRVRGPGGKFVVKNDMFHKDLSSGLNYQTTANTVFAAMPENVLAPLPTNPAIAPMGNGLYHVLNYRSIASSPQGLYRNLDESLRSCPQTALAMVNDASITGPLFQRWMALASYNDAVVPADENDPEQVEVCEKLQDDISNIPRWTEYKKNLMWAAWYGKHVNVNNYQFDYSQGQRRLSIRDWYPIIGDKLVFRNNGKMGYLSFMPTGFRDVVYSDHGLAELFNEDDRDCLVHHKYFVTDTSWNESMLAIGVEGFGYRHFLYWPYWLKQQVLEWMLQALQIVGAMGIRIGFFEQSNPESEAAVANALAQSNGSNIVLFPRPIGDEKQGAGLEIIGPQGIDLGYFIHTVEDYFGAQIKHMLLGFDYEEKREDYYTLQCYDAAGLSETITRDLLNVLIKYNYPEAVDWGLKYIINVPVPDTNRYLEACQRAWELGLPLQESELYAKLGLTKPSKNKRMVIKSNQETQDQTIRSPRKNVGSLKDNLAGSGPSQEAVPEELQSKNTESPMGDVA